MFKTVLSDKMLSLFFALPIAALVALVVFGPKLWRRVYGPWMMGGMVLGAVLIAILLLYTIFRSASSTAAS